MPAPAASDHQSRHSGLKPCVLKVSLYKCIYEYKYAFGISGNISSVCFNMNVFKALDTQCICCYKRATCASKTSCNSDRVAELLTAGCGGGRGAH